MNILTYDCSTQSIEKCVISGGNYPAFSPPSPMRRSLGGGTSPFHPPSHMPGTSPPVHGHMAMQTGPNHSHVSAESIYSFIIYIEM